jgi:hypothetical protein
LTAASARLGESIAGLRLIGRVGLAAFGCVALWAVLLVLGNVLTLPDEDLGMSPSVGPTGVALAQLLGKPVTTDFLIDYASANALLRGQDPYEISENLIARTDAPAWEIQIANPHPPSVLPIVLPFALLPYRAALAAWALTMAIGYFVSLRMMGLRGPSSLVATAACVLFWPGAYAIGNVVSVTAIGVAMAYRFRDSPWIAGLGIAWAATPKAAGLLLLIPFVITGRLRAAFAGCALFGFASVLPAFFFPQVWSSYWTLGTDAIASTRARPDNASILNLFERLGVPGSLALALLAAIASGAAVKSRDTFWPIVWLSVAALPIAWMYSLMAFVPLVALSFGESDRKCKRTLFLTGVSVIIAVGSPPLGVTPTKVFPLICLLLLGVVSCQTPIEPFWRNRAQVHIGPV